MAIPVSIVYSVKNEELNIRNSLKDVVFFFDDIWVVDSNSVDLTKKYCLDFGVNFINFNWNGRFPKKRNWALRTISFKYEWILFLDADEQVTSQFIHEILSKIANTEYVGYWLTYENFFMGKKLRFGDKMRKLALFKKDAGEYEQIEEDSWSHLDMEVHEHPVIQGKVGVIKSPLIHNDFKGLEKYIDRHNAYSTWEAKRYLQLKKDLALKLTFRQKLKYGLLETGLLPYIYFFGAYFLKLGFLDGKEGYYLAQYKKHYFFQIQTKIKELKA